MAVKGVGRSETCLFHPDQPATTRCRACHKPLCAACVVSTADGKFCSRECAARTADFNKSYKPGGGGVGKITGLIKTLVKIIVVIAILGAVNKYFLKNDMPVIGKLLNKLPFFGTSGEAIRIPKINTDILNTEKAPEAPKDAPAAE